MIIEFNFIKNGNEINSDKALENIEKVIYNIDNNCKIINVISMSNWFLVIIEFQENKFSRDFCQKLDIIAGTIVLRLDCQIRYRHYEVHGVTGSLAFHKDWRTLVGLHTIAKDEDKTVKEWLIKYNYLFNDTVIAVDNTTVDSTNDMVAQGGGRWLTWNWNDRYDDAYNFAKDNCNTEWIFKLDIDEDLTPELEENLRKLCMTDEYDAVEFNVYNEVWKDTIRQVRLFRKNIGYWDGPLHPALRGIADARILKTDYTIIHHQTWIAVGGKVAEERQAFYDYLVKKWEGQR